MVHVDIPQWALIYVVSFALLHLAIYYYYLRGEQGGDSPHPSLSGENGGEYSPGNPFPPEHREAAPDRREPDRSAADDEGRRCPHCGAVNEPESTYTYCHQCVERLGI